MKPKFTWVAVLVGGAILLGVSSCATMSTEPLAPGEVRLVNATIPSGEVLFPGIAYDVRIDFKADGRPTIRRVCFSWSGDGPYCSFVNPEAVAFGTKGSLIVPLVPSFYGTYRVECYAEYMDQGRIKRTNEIGFQAFVRSR